MSIDVQMLPDSREKLYVCVVLFEKFLTILLSVLGPFHILQIRNFRKFEFTILINATKITKILQPFFLLLTKIRVIQILPVF